MVLYRLLLKHLQTYVQNAIKCNFVLPEEWVVGEVMS